MTTIIWLGISLSLRERTVVKEQFRQICLSNLQDAKDKVTEKIQSLELQFDDSNKNITVYNALDNKPTDPLINQLFILNNERQLEYPKPDSVDLSDKEKTFLARTREIWDSGERFYRPDEYNYIANNNEQVQQEQSNQNDTRYQSLPQSLYENQETQSNIESRRNNNQQKQQVVMLGNRKNSYLNSTNLSSLVKPSTGWYSWFQGKGLNFILWKRNKTDQIIGFELNREKMIETIIETLPQTTSNNTQHFKLTNATGELHSWGNYQPLDNQLPIAEVSINAPLQSWKLYCYFNDSHLTMASSQTIFYNYILGGSILGILIFILCIYFYRENSRQLQESSKKVNFVNQVSHELKTPLTNIRMYAELLERNLKHGNNKAQKQLGVIVSESQRLSRLISNVLSFAQKDKKKLKLNIRKVELESFLKSIVNYYSPIMERKGISLELNIDNETTLDADSDALEQILGNLLSNIEKYVPQSGEATITCKTSSKQAIITVSDNGPGIPVKQREKIFDSFHRVSNSLSDGVSGTGIGLTISRDLARLHGGDLILLNSDLGASFQLSLPIN